ncbi:uncharacterized protein LOC119168077 isoform X1 [Rhipicephalus microplus]|uniref:uncharacterized protein LOC119168077 isoform X1 n=1 Tax=Rhipicephalus microplus TaxID=6941 RepID=UPI003F6A8CB1
MSPPNTSAPLSVPDTRLLFAILLAIALTTTIFSKCVLAVQTASRPQQWIYKNKDGFWEHMELCFFAKTRWDCNMVSYVACPPKNSRVRFCSDTDYLDCTQWTLRSGFTFCSCHCGVEQPLMIPAVQRGPGNHSIQVTTPAPSKSHGSHHG